jgi:hypothetical protein
VIRRPTNPEGRSTLWQRALPGETPSWPRFSSDTLWRYAGNGVGGFTSRVKVASDWGVSYNAVLGVGDITADGKADIVSRDTSGTLWRNNGTGKGSFGPRVKVATGWQGYKGVF